MLLPILFTSTNGFVHLENMAVANRQEVSQFKMKEIQHRKLC
jgi:hypothetical protein